jgi:predicted RNA binding protein YcfA (HicA-like mRNA interferase family)
MNDRIPALKARDLMRALKKLGFAPIRQKGSHIAFKHPDGRFTLVSQHPGEDIGRGLLRQILREIEVSPQEFLKYL